MKSIKNLGKYPTGLTLTSDDLVEFHSARLLLLILLCGKKDLAKKQVRIEGLTKFAKLDFFVRYPEFFRKAASFLSKEINNHNGGIESRMIRFHYGPWDNRYYQLLPYLESKRLIEIEKRKNSYEIYLTDAGKKIAEILKDEDEFKDLVTNMKSVSSVLGHMTGSKLKELVYSLFKEEVSDKNLGELIK
jgi:hypothetical protein